MFSSLKKTMDKAYIERLSTFDVWPKGYMLDPRIMASAGFVLRQIDETICQDCGIGFRDWEVDDKPIELHKKNSPDCMFIKHFPEGYMASDEDIVNNWLMSTIVQTYMQASDYSIPIIKAGLNQRLNTKFRNFTSLREIHLYFREKKPLKCYDEVDIHYMGKTTKDITKICKLCHEKKIDTVFVDCGHSIACKSCADKIITCRICFQYIKRAQVIVE